MTLVDREFRFVRVNEVFGVFRDKDPAEVGRIAVTGLDAVPSDLHGSASYRKKVGAAMVARAWEQAVKEAASG